MSPSDQADAVMADGEDLLIVESAATAEPLPMWEPTGEAEVDAILDQLHELVSTDLHEHAAVFERIDSSLRSTLDGLTIEDSSA